MTPPPPSPSLGSGEPAEGSGTPALGACWPVEESPWLLVMRRTCLFRAHLHLCRVCSPLVLFRRKLVSSMSHRFFLPRKCQWDLGSGIFCRGGDRWAGPATTWLAGPVHDLGIKRCQRLSSREAQQGKCVSPIYLDIQILRILVRRVCAAKKLRWKIPRYKKNIKSAHFRSGRSISALAAASFLLPYVMDKIWLLVQPLHVSSTSTKWMA